MLGNTAIIIPAEDDYRAKEQTTNAEHGKKIDNGLIKILQQDTSVETLVSVCENILMSNNNKSNLKWKSGNFEAQNLILNLHNKKIFGGNN